MRSETLMREELEQDTTVHTFSEAEIVDRAGRFLNAQRRDASNLVSADPSCYLAFAWPEEFGASNTQLRRGNGCFH